MHLLRLQVDGLRCLNGLDLSLGPGLHVFIGPNGAGKTSILEAIALLGSGRSFRAGGKEALIARNAEQLTVFAELVMRDRQHVIGFERNRKSWRARLDGADVTQLAQLVRLAPVWVIEPSSHELISGGSEQRRALIDWLLFHVEPSYGNVAARYKAALKQRNAALRAEASDAELEPWTEQLLRLGIELADLRECYLSDWLESVRQCSEQLLPELGAASVRYRSGWPEDLTPAAALNARLARDRALGYSSAGPHRADWSLSFELAPEREQFSRGQAKNACFAAVFGTLQRYRALTGEAPVLCLDDLFSELDQDHQAHCLRLAATVAEQVLVTGVALSGALAVWPGAVKQHSVSFGIGNGGSS